MTITFSHSLRGYLVGPIWQPGLECSKPLAYDITREDARFLEPGSLRDHVLAATNDGDFRWCEIADGELVTVATIERGGRKYRRERVTPLTACKSIADMVRDDWGGPDFDDEE